MKKLMTVCLIVLSTQAFSQGFVGRVAKRIDFGLKAGVNYSNFTDANFPTDPLVGFHAGGTIAFKITKNFMIQQDILFSTQGAKNKSDLFDKKDIKLYYVTIPLLVKYKTNFGFYVEAGAQAGMKVDENVKGLNNTEFAKKVDVGAVGGIGFQSKLGLGIGARYIYGLSKLGNFDVSNINNDFKNNNAQVSIFYVF